MAVIPLLGGTFDGSGYAISHLTTDGVGCLGLFGRLETGAEVKDLGVVDVNVVGSGSHVGGLVGDNRGTVADCYSTGTISGYWWSVGGLVGQNCGTLTQCYSSGTVTGDGDVGGLVGSNWFDGTLTQCYSTGAVSGRDEVGGLVAHNSGGVVTASFWDTQTSGQATSAGGTGKTTAEMQTAKTFLDVGWDFVGETANGTEDIWKIAEGLGYPRLAWEKYSGGTQEPTDPYQIATAADLIALGETPEDYDKHFILTADIDLDPNLPGGKVFDKAVIAPSVGNADREYGGTPFYGVFDGNRHTISHLTIKGKNFLGLFGWLGGGAKVKNLGLAGVSITGSGRWIGGLAGLSCGSVVSCHSTGAVSGKERVGGLVGYNAGSDYTYGCVTTSYAAGTVIGELEIGGLVGANGGDVASCYSSDRVSGTDRVGGLVGANLFVFASELGLVMGCYSSGAVSGNAHVGGLVGSGWFGGGGDIGPDSFWDTQTSGALDGVGDLDPDPNGVIDKTTAEMQTAKTFLDAGWDFVGETANGTEDIWKIAEGLDYPRLWWEPYDGRVTVVLGQVFTVTLESNPSTGYRWEWVDHQDSIVEQMGEAQFKPRETGDPPLVGAGGWESFDFKAVHPGQMTLKLVYRRPWEEGVEPLKTFSLQVTVP